MEDDQKLKEEVDLGFVESIESYRLESIFFPSKVGGRPAWLNQTELPNSTDLQCSNCGNVLRFLLQIYAPRDNIAECFHRMIYVFCCGNIGCFKKNSNAPFKAFRNQLTRTNTFFKYEPSPENMEESEVLHEMSLLREKWGMLCEVCGCPAKNKCAACKTVFYCCKNHQTVSWKESHKSECENLKKNTADKTVSPKSSSFNFPEFELVTEAEVSCIEASNRKTKLDERDHLIEGQHGRTCLGDIDDIPKEQLALMKELEDKEDKQFQKFKETIAQEVDQVLRYSYKGKPLWVSSHHIPKASEIPNCSCGSPRVFEFQILPQLLNHLKVDSLEESIDWGTVAAYTCSSNCTSNQTYSQEFIWKQDFSDTTVT